VVASIDPYVRVATLKMVTLSEEVIRRLIHPYVGDAYPAELCSQLSSYLDLLLKWNARTNLTAIREPEEIVTRHFGESLFVGRNLGECDTLLDFGSGAGFPGLPIQLLRPDVAVTLAESQNKKATFLREAVRQFGLKTEVWGSRVESMLPERQFEVVTMRAVDNMEEAQMVALSRILPGGRLFTLGSAPDSTRTGLQLPLPNSRQKVLCIDTVPRGT